MELADLIRQMEADGQFSQLANNRLAQFGTGTRNYMGATVLPERLVPTNSFTEWAIAFRSVIANAAARHSPVQKRGNMKIGSFAVSLADSDSGYELTAPDWEALNRALQRNDSMTASALVQQIYDKMVLQPLMDHNEKNRWDAVIDEHVVLTGDDGFSVTITDGYVASAGYIFNATTTWSNASTGDPFKDIYAVRDLFAADGRDVAKIVAPTPVITIIQNSPSVRNRLGGLTVSSGALVTVQGRATLEGINALLNDDGLPPIEPYNLKYNDESSSHFFHARNAMTLFATTNQDETIVDPSDDATPLVTLTNVLGYTGVGVPSGQTAPGRATYVENFRNKPPRTQFEAWQTTLPVLLNDKARSVIKAIS